MAEKKAVKKIGVEGSITKIEKEIKSKKKISGDRKDELSDNLDDIGTKVDKQNKSKKLSDSKATSLKNRIDGVKNMLDTDDSEDNGKKGKRKSKKGAPVTKIIINSKVMTKKEALKKANKKLGGIINKINEKKLGSEEVQASSSKKGERKDDIEIKKLEDLDDDMTIKELKELEKKGIRVIFPNLKYNKPKYSNVSELIKYVESDKPQEGGVKIIIMNFND